jgi:polysaccharide pyruvyl transferase WcaK-like protein
MRSAAGARDGMASSSKDIEDLPMTDRDRIKVYLFNDTSRSRHAGCKAVMRSLRAELAGFAEVIATHTVGSTTIDPLAFAQCDAVVVNGEGTIHHDSPRANFLVTMLAAAQAAGKRTALVNALYQQERLPVPDVLARLDFMSVREVRSAAQARRHGGCPWVLIDSAADCRQLKDAAPLRTVSGIVKGGTHPKAPSATWLDSLDVPRVDVATGTLDEIVATLRQADVYVTGQHHGLYAAALAGVPFVALISNSHKIEGLIEWSGLPIPVVDNEPALQKALAFALNNRDVFERFSAFIAQQDVTRAGPLAAALRAGRP